MVVREVAKHIWPAWGHHTAALEDAWLAATLGKVRVQLVGEFRVSEWRYAG
jgi:hypothetical protein